MTTLLQVADLGELKRITAGGQATLYSFGAQVLPNVTGELVYKNYHPTILKKYAQAIRYGLPRLLEIPEKMPAVDRELFSARTTWPLALVLDGDDATGIIMKRIRPVFEFTMQKSSGPKQKLLEVKQVLRPEAQRKTLGVPELSFEQRGRLVARLAICLDLFHRNGLVVGDLSGGNIAVSNPEKLAEVYPKFLDTDSFRPAGGQPPVQQGNTAGWLVPETAEADAEAGRLAATNAPMVKIAKAQGRARVLDKRTDVFKFGLLAMRLFDAGPDAADTYSSAHAEDRIRQTFGTHRSELLRACRDESPANRPQMAELARLFTP